MGGAGCQVKQGGADCTTKYDTVVHLGVHVIKIRSHVDIMQWWWIWNVNRVVSHSKPEEGILCYGYLADIKQMQDAKPQS